VQPKVVFLTREEAMHRLLRGCSCAMWMGYGIAQGVSTVILVNLIGFVLSAIYMAIFYTYAKEKACNGLQYGRLVRRR